MINILAIAIGLLVTAASVAAARFLVETALAVIGRSLKQLDEADESPFPHSATI
jgi:hypothetical protein